MIFRKNRNQDSEKIEINTAFNYVIKSAALRIGFVLTLRHLLALLASYNLYQKDLTSLESQGHVAGIDGRRAGAGP